jgi:hypothetical protein
VQHLGEASTVFEPLKDGEERIIDDRYVLYFGLGTSPWSNVVQRLRLGDVRRDVEDVRRAARERARPEILWEVSTAAEPRDLGEQLLALGMTRADPPNALVLATDGAPAPADLAITVSAVESIGDMKSYVRVTHEVFARHDELREELARIDRDGAPYLSDRRFVRYLAYLDGQPVGAAAATFTDAGAILHSGSTLAAARGRGVYRALVRARWEETERRGAPRLVTRAGPMSRSILSRLGFRQIATIDFFVDRVSET